MSLLIEETLEIGASGAVVWEVITDLPRYPEWNPFVVECRSTLAIGDPIDMRVALIGGTPRSQRETIFEHVSGERLCYGLRGGALGALASNRCHVVSRIGSERARYQSRFELSGWLSPLVRGLLGTRLRHGFHSMTTAIQRRAEEIARERSG